MKSAHANPPTAAAHDPVIVQVRALMDRARAAQWVFEAYDQAQVDEAVTAVAWAVVKPENNRELAELAVAETDLGKVEDKLAKNRRKTMGLLRDLQGVRSVGVIAEYPERGIVEIARPVGVVAAVIPATNPVATPVNKAMNALKGRNAVIFAPSPKGQQSGARLVKFIHDELTRVGAPRDLVQQLRCPVSREATQKLMEQADLVVATGSQKNVRAAYGSGTPAFGVGTGNVPAIVDDSADLEDAATKIALSKTFDYATSCSSENSLIILDAVYEPMLEVLAKVGGRLLTAAETVRLQAGMWLNGNLNRKVIAKSAPTICQVLGLTREALREAQFLMVQEEGIGPEFPLSGEKLSPVLTLYRAADFNTAFDITRRILEYQGKGHSCGIHTHNNAHIERLGLEMPVCRVIVNQAHCLATGGNFDNGLPFSLSMGCGTWGRNNFSNNLNYRHYLNITRIARLIRAPVPSEEDLFGAYRAKYGVTDAYLTTKA